MNRTLLNAAPEIPTVPQPHCSASQCFPHFNRLHWLAMKEDSKLQWQIKQEVNFSICDSASSLLLWSKMSTPLWYSVMIRVLYEQTHTDARLHKPPQVNNLLHWKFIPDCQMWLKLSFINRDLLIVSQDKSELILHEQDRKSRRTLSTKEVEERQSLVELVTIARLSYKQLSWTHTSPACLCSHFSSL